MKKFLAVLLVFFLSSCVSYVLVPPQKIAVSGLIVEPGVAWNAKNVGGGNLWTIDGLSLQALTFVNIVNGGSIIKQDNNTGPQVLYFHADMTEVEIMDLFIVPALVLNLRL
jgi:hypothetical protein